MPGDIVVPVDTFLYMSAFLTSIEYSNLIRAFWPDGDPDELIQKKLRKMSCHKLTATFFNKKTLEIEYNFDITKTGRERVLIRFDCLLPILGGLLAPGMDDVYVNFDTCSDYYYVDNLCVWCSDYHVSPIRFKEPTSHFALPPLLWETHHWIVR
ncbi:unnamed protein product [Euphydryas editha]|uniref:Uncharacterized protein n=1 Tax=Euphydryas editha TaxID=104508 RepID=A0AAU9TL54_EUPED|nr:unnamed protein product [Euphydryas editha]